MLLDPGGPSSGEGEPRVVRVETRAKRPSARARSGLVEYDRKRDFDRTPEPRGATGRGKAARAGLAFVVQEHRARRLHYDFRLELDGALKSWAVPKGPSLDTGVRRMAVETEDHPLDYADFEGVIPAGEYGGGTVLIWDRGSWEPIGDPHAALRKGHLEFRLAGKKLRGRWHLVRMEPRAADRGKKNWLLIKASNTELRERAKGRAAVPALPREALPAKLEPQLATLVDAAPDGPEWLHEIKFDGYRLLTRIQHGAVRLLTRAGNDWTARMPALAASLAGLPVDTALLDGEVVALDEHGRSRFQLLQRALQGGGASLHFYAFDLLHVDGFDLRAAPLTSRKEALRKLLARVRRDPTLHYSDHVQGGGAVFFAEACRNGLEGIVSKLASSPYRSGRSRTWLKRKCGQRQEFVVVGFTEPAGSRVGLGALLLGVHGDDGALRYCGKVGTGFDDDTLARLRKRLAALERPKPSVVDPKRAERRPHWVAPELVAEVSFSEWTRDGKIRHPSFVALRTDKPASAIRREIPRAVAGLAKPPRSRAKAAAAPAQRSEVAGVRLSTPGRVYFPDLGVTKSELAQYYETMAERVVPALANRPLSLVRCPSGCNAKCFYQKHATDSIPERVGRVAVNRGEKPYTMVTDLASIVSLVQIAVIEFHVWGSRADRIERPDLLVFDLDPDPSVPWRRVAEAAQLLRLVLTELELVPFLRTTGGKGLHVVVPLVRRSTWNDVKSFTHDVALRIVREAPDRYTALFSKRKRHGKILIDTLRNQRDATAIASYSLRARPGAPVAIPLGWDELDLRAEGPPTWSIREAPERLAMDDPWQAFEASRRVLTARARVRVRDA